jgi:hypothetical protein
MLVSGPSRGRLRHRGVRVQHVTHSFSAAEVVRVTCDDRDLPGRLAIPRRSWDWTAHAVSAFVNQHCDRQSLLCTRTIGAQEQQIKATGKPRSGLPVERAVRIERRANGEIGQHAILDEEAGPPGQAFGVAAGQVQLEPFHRRKRHHAIIVFVES